MYYNNKIIKIHYVLYKFIKTRCVHGQLVSYFSKNTSRTLEERTLNIQIQIFKYNTTYINKDHLKEFNIIKGNFSTNSIKKELIIQTLSSNNKQIILKISKNYY